MIDGPVDLLDTGKMAVLADMDQVTPEGELPASGNQAFFQTPGQRGFSVRTQSGQKRPGHPITGIDQNLKGLNEKCQIPPYCGAIKIRWIAGEPQGEDAGALTVDGAAGAGLAQHGNGAAQRADGYTVFFRQLLIGRQILHFPVFPQIDVM